VRCFLPLACTPLGEPYLLTGAGDVIRAYDLSDALASLPSSAPGISSGEAELLGEVDAHWHDVTALRFWARRTATDAGGVAVEPWVVSASLDGTLRKWRLSGACRFFLLSLSCGR
jgi:hypothetical protein